MFDSSVAGGVGISRGRRSTDRINPGDTLDFWRVLVADRKNHRLLLYSEMKIPGEAWLEFGIKETTLAITSTFRPKGLSGRIYWILLKPIHSFIIRGMIKSLARKAKVEGRGT